MTRRLRSVAMAALVLGLMLTACDVVAVSEPPRTGLSKQEIEKFAQIQLCAPAANVQSYTEKVTNRQTLVKFVVPSAALEQCAREAGFTEPLKPFKLTFAEATRMKGVPGWWSPSGAVNPLAGERQDTGFIRKLMVDRANPAEYVMYLLNFEY